MLRKLFKYEFLATARAFGLAYAGLIVMSVLAGLSFRLANHGRGVILSLLAMFLYSALVGVVIVATLVQIIGRFNENLLKGQGYLMNILPVHTWQLIVSKLLVALLQGICALIVSLISAGIIFVGTVGIKETLQMSRFLPLLIQSLDDGMTLGLYLILMLVNGLLAFAAGILMIYAAMAVGQLVNHHRALTSFGVFVGFYIVKSVVEGVILTGGFGSNLTVSSVGGGTSIWISYQSAAGNLVSMLLTVLFGVIFFMVTEELLRWKLNLQ